MLLDRWRARRAILSRTPPSSVEEPAGPALRPIVEDLRVRLCALNSLGDPSWHFRWEGDLQLVGLDASSRSVSDVRQRLLRVIHELDLRHLPRRARRLVAVIVCAPDATEGLQGWHARLQEDKGEVGEKDWRAARGRVTVLALDPSGQHMLFGGDEAIAQAVQEWDQASRPS